MPAFKIRSITLGVHGGDWTLFMLLDEFRRPSQAKTSYLGDLEKLASHLHYIQEIGHGADGYVTRCTSMISRPRPTIRSTSPGRAAWSGNSARRVVASGLVVTWQSSNCARSLLPAWPLKVISYVCDRTRSMP